MLLRDQNSVADLLTSVVLNVMILNTTERLASPSFLERCSPRSQWALLRFSHSHFLHTEVEFRETAAKLLSR